MTTIIVGENKTFGGGGNLFGIFSIILKTFLVSIRRSFGGVYKAIKDGSKLQGKGV
jgi:hypothetical protein